MLSFVATMIAIPVVLIMVGLVWLGVLGWVGMKMGQL